MEFQGRQMVHMVGIIVVFILVMLWVDFYHIQKQPKPSGINIDNYVWLASINLQNNETVTNAMIREGAAAMLVARRGDALVRDLKLKHNQNLAMVLALHVFDQNSDHIISIEDDLFRQLYLASYVDGQLRLVDLEASHVRGIKVNKKPQQGDVEYRAVLSDGRAVAMTTAPRDQPLNVFRESPGFNF
jgi:hypothetical protein